MAKAPSPPNPYAQAAAQQSSDLFSATASNQMNNVNEVSPYGSVKYNNIGYTTIYDAQGHPQQVPRSERVVTLSPDQQKLHGLQTQTQYNLGTTGVQQSAKVGKMLNTSLDTNGLQGWSRGAAPGQIRQDQTATDRPAIEQALMGRYQEQAGKAASTEDAQLAARGLNPGGGHYGRVADTRARALTDASQQAYLASGAESRAQQGAYNQAEQQRYQESSDYASQLNNLRQAQFGERTALRNQPLNEISALLSGSQVTVPQFSPFSRQGINAAPTGQYMSDAYGNQMQAYSNMMQGITGMGSALIGGAMGPGGFLTGL